MSADSDMEHEYIKDLLSAYHDRELSPEQTAVVEEHLGSCAECRAELDHFKALDRIVAEKSGLSDSAWI